MINDTIAAISTPNGLGGISVIRISGPNAVEVASKVFKGAVPLKNKKGYTAEFGHVYINNKVLDECIATVFLAPKSYTGENVVELSCHGGMLVTKKLLGEVLNCGARMANPGEFTSRAFFNGKMDLSEAEAVMDLIGAKTEQALSSAVENKSGKVGRKVTEITDNILNLIAEISAYCDYPDDESMGINPETFVVKAKEIKAELNLLIENYENGKKASNGIKVAIIGKPNVGKSTLMNYLSGTDRSIVTEIPGTTRDVIDTDVMLYGLPLNLIDTAGLRKTDDPVEKIGVEKSEKALISSDIALMMFSVNETISKEEKELLKKYKDKTVAVINKTDLNVKTDEFNGLGVPTVYISAKNEVGDRELYEAIKKVASIKELSPGAVILGSLRQKQNCQNAEKCITEAIEAIESGITVDAVSVLLSDAVGNLQELTGAKVSDEIANKVFEHFCVGK